MFASSSSLNLSVIKQRDIAMVYNYFCLSMSLINRLNHAESVQKFNTNNNDFASNILNTIGLAYNII
jgi:hypothetical protein